MCQQLPNVYKKYFMHIFLAVGGGRFNSNFYEMYSCQHFQPEYIMIKYHVSSKPYNRSFREPCQPATDVHPEITAQEGRSDTNNNNVG